MNIQRPLKQALGPGILVVNEIFYSIQGEGPYAGRPAVFIRLGGCNLRCEWCDTDYTTGNTTNSLEEVMKAVEAELSHLTVQNNMLVVITGGEPFRQYISGLCVELVNRGYEVQVETNGTLSNPFFPWESVTVVVSPKISLLHEDIRMNAKHFKYVISRKDKISEDGFPVTPTQSVNGIPSKRIPDDATIYLMPLDESDEEANRQNEKTVVDLCRRHEYIVALQLHKILGLR